jgi:UDP-N-acetyl-D-mannosaminuronate dehydrogenase
MKNGREILVIGLANKQEVVDIWNSLTNMIIDLLKKYRVEGLTMFDYPRNTTYQRTCGAVRN